MQNQENENYQDTFSQFSQQLMSSNWKSRKDTLEIISKNMENQQLQSVFWQLVNTLMRDQNIQCLGLTLQILHDEVLNIPRNRLEEIVFILVNNNLLNQKTSIHKITEDLLLAISSQYPKLVLDTITVSLDSKIAKQIKSSLLFIQLLVMQQHQLETKQISQLDFCQSLLNILQTKDLLVRKQVIEVIDLLLQMSTNQQELLDFLQSRLDKQLFQSIVNQLMTEHVSDEEIVTVLQEKTEKPEKQSPQSKKQVNSPTRNTQIVGQSLGNSHFLKEDTYTPSYTELQQLSGMNWKDRKQILEQLTKEFEEAGKITQQLSSEFCRQLRQLLEEENNFPCLNQLIRLTGEICLKVQGCKYLRTLFSALFQCLRNKKCQSQAQTTLLQLLQVVRIQDIIDSDILPAMQTRQTEFKIDVLNFIKTAYWLNPNGQNDQILSGCIIRDASQHEKLLKLLLTMCNDSNNMIRQAASDALVQFIAVHIQLKQYCNIVYQLIVQGYIQDAHEPPQTPQQLISVILTFNGQQTVRSNEQRRGSALLTSLLQLLAQFNIPSYVTNLSQVFNFSAEVQQLIDQLNQNTPQQRNILKKNIQDKSISPNKLSKSQQLEQDFQWMSQQRQGINQPEMSQSPQYQDITKIQQLTYQSNPIQQVIQKYQMQLQSADQQLLYNLYGEIVSVLQNLSNFDRNIAIDIIFDTMIQHMAQGDENLLMQCIQFIKQLILQWQADVHPTTILKSLDVLIFRLEEPQPQQFIYDFITCATRLYGLQLPVFFVQKYVAEQFIVNTLLDLLFKQIQEFGLQGLDFGYNILYNRTNTQCNITELFLMCTQTECDHQQILHLMNLISSILAMNDQETLFLMQQQIQDNQILSTICVQLQRIELQQPQDVISPIQLQQTLQLPIPQKFESKIPVISSAIIEQQKSKISPRQQQYNVEDFDVNNHQSTLNSSSLQKPTSPKISNPNIQTVQHIQMANTSTIQDVISLKMYFMEIFQTESPKYVLHESGVKKHVINFINPEVQNNVQRFIQIIMQCNGMITQQLIQHSFMNNIFGQDSDIYQIQELITQIQNQEHSSEILCVLLYINLCQSVIYNDIQQHNAICRLFKLVNKEENYLDILLLYTLQATYQSQNCQQLIEFNQDKFELKSLLNSVYIVFIDKYQNHINGTFLLYQTLNLIANILRTSTKNQPFSVQDLQYFVKCILSVRSQLYYYDVELIIQELQRITDSSDCIKDLSIDIQKDLTLPQITPDLKQYLQYLNNYTDNEQFIYGLKQIIIYIRDHRDQSYNSIVVKIQENICTKLFQHVHNGEQPNSRLLKYCALLLLELLNDQKSLKYIPVQSLQKIMRMSSYYLIIYIPGLQLNDQSQQKLFSESYENFTLVFQRITMDIPFYYRYKAFIGELYNICNLLMTKDITYTEQPNQAEQKNYTFLDEIQFINQYQTQFVIKNLLQMQQLLKKEFGEQQIDMLIKQIVISGLQDQFNNIMYLISSSTTQPIQASELMQLITSQPYSGLAQIDQLLSQISAKQEIELKELKLFLRFIRIFVEYYISSLVEIQFSACAQQNYFMLLVQAVSESKQVISSFQGSLIRDSSGSYVGSQQNSQVKSPQARNSIQKSINNFGGADSEIIQSLRNEAGINFDVLLTVYQKIKGFPEYQRSLEQLLIGNGFQASIVSKIQQQITRLQQCENAIMKDLRK